MTIEPISVTRKQKLIAVSFAVALVVVGGAAYYWVGKHAPDGSVAVTHIDGLPEGASIEVVDSVDSRLFDSTPRPALNRPLPKGGTADEVYALMVKHRAEAVAMITENPALMTQWLGLGAAHKQVGDYEGARIYFTYVATVNPRNLAAHLNLGNLYGYYLKDLGSAELSFSKAIEVDATYAPAYIELYLVRKAQGNIERAVAALTDGLAKNPGDVHLSVTLAHHYRDVHDVPSAKAAYASAIAAAKKVNDAPLAAALAAELAALN